MFEKKNVLFDEAFRESASLAVIISFCSITFTFDFAICLLGCKLLNWKNKRYLNWHI